MPHDISTLTLPLPLHMGTANCYLPALTGVAPWNSSPWDRNHDHRRLHGVQGGQMRQPCLTVTD
jgi:hypothetical protein